MPTDRLVPIDSGTVAAGSEAGSDRSSLAGLHMDHARDWHRQMVEEAAYFRAAKRGFKGGDPLVDWLEAEAEIEELTKGLR